MLEEKVERKDRRNSSYLLFSEEKEGREVLFPSYLERSHEGGRINKGEAIDSPPSLIESSEKTGRTWTISSPII